MIVRTELYDEAEVVDMNDWQYKIKVTEGNSVFLEWIDRVKCEKAEG